MKVFGIPYYKYLHICTTLYPFSGKTILTVILKMLQTVIIMQNKKDMLSLRDLSSKKSNTINGKKIRDFLNGNVIVIYENIFLFR